MLNDFLKINNFFGVTNASKIESILLHMATNGIRPEWLKNSPRLKNLPRFTSKKTGQPFYIGILNPDQLSERITWVVNTLEGEWHLDSKHIYINQDTDMVYYRLRWEDKPKYSEKSS